jgi:ferritin
MGIGPHDTAFRLELTAAQLKLTHAALKSFLDDFGREQHEVHEVLREILAKLPPEGSIRAIDLDAELAKRRATSA